ncbi:hypothetical protein Q5762_16520 [Streptomyces sp. P9(2023)]|uniref:hypothetical protein n=1 Tax=Streptomyces sp. P9(2023) TaxID=3064394 RepID=UPI0028F44AC0|nr:hypothetical protein [Streptomyces sp. P9(2023)]MDT9689916.1 hypothetical protein [Streptomyces sp. P9(2023)]
MRISRRGISALLAAPLTAALLISCSGTADKPADEGSPRGATASPPAAGDSGATGDEGQPESGAEPTAPTVLVRDAFAGLQATLNDSCATDCAYFLGRVYDELDRLDGAMKADPKGPGHFPEPIAWIEKLRTTLAGDREFANLKKRQALLIGTRDRINTWMQGHPDDYR